MAYTDNIECPHCHETIELEIEIEYAGYDDIYAVMYPIKEEVKQCTQD